MGLASKDPVGVSGHTPPSILLAASLAALPVQGGVASKPFGQCRGVEDRAFENYARCKRDAEARLEASKDRDTHSSDLARCTLEYDSALHEMHLRPDRCGTPNSRDPAVDR